MVYAEQHIESYYKHGKIRGNYLFLEMYTCRGNDSGLGVKGHGSGHAQTDCCIHVYTARSVSQKIVSVFCQLLNLQ